MNYELAKKLKDAGFPLYSPDLFSAGVWEIDTKAFHVPTLSELIEACGENFASLGNCRKEGKRFWLAEYWNNPGMQAPGLRIEGNTPEEAVANLWLQLHDILA